MLPQLGNDSYFCVNILDCKKSFVGLVDSKPYKFEKLLALKRSSFGTDEKHKGYRIFIFSSELQKLFEKSAMEIKYSNPLNDMENVLRLEFVQSMEFVDIQFKSVEEYQNFRTFCQNVVGLKELQNTEYSFSSYKSKILYVQKPSTSLVQKSVKKISSLSSAPKNLSSKMCESETSSRKFFEMKYEVWSFKEFLEWMNHVIVQEELDKNCIYRITTLKKYLERCKLLNLIRDFFRDFSSTTVLFFRHLRDFVKKGIVEETLGKVFSNSLAKETLVREFAYIIENDGYFEMNYFAVLKKIVKHNLSSLVNGSIQIKDLVFRMRCRERYLWDSDSCRLFIISLLILNRNIDEYVNIKYDKKYENLELSENKHKEIKFLVKQNNEVSGVKVENISYFAFRAFEFAKLVKRKKKLLEKEKKRKIDVSSELKEIEENMKIAIENDSSFVRSFYISSRRRNEIKILMEKLLLEYFEKHKLGESLNELTTNYCLSKNYELNEITESLCFSNIQMKWSESQIVEINVLENKSEVSKYFEIMGIDCNLNYLFLKVNDLLSIITKLSEAIVSVNVNETYSHKNGNSKFMKKFLVDKLSVFRYYNELLKIIGFVKKNKSSSGIRRFTPTKEFLKKYNEVIMFKKFHDIGVIEKTNDLVFRNQQLMDAFVQKIIEKDWTFAFKFPQIWEILKSYYRGFLLCSGDIGKLDIFLHNSKKEENCNMLSKKIIEESEGELDEGEEEIEEASNLSVGFDPFFGHYDNDDNAAGGKKLNMHDDEFWGENEENWSDGEIERIEDIDFWKD